MLRVLRREVDADAMTQTGSCRRKQYERCCPVPTPIVAHVMTNYARAFQDVFEILTDAPGKTW